MPKVSIIIPVYNTSKYLDKCIQTLINQTLKDIEIIFIDDGSTDDSLQKINSYADNDERIVVLTQKHKKQGAARDYGMSIAKGEYIGFVDSDDYIDVDMYQCMYEIAEREHCDVVRCRMVREDFDGSIEIQPDKRFDMGKLVQISSLDDRKRIMLQGLPGGVVCGLYRHSFIKENKLYFPEGIIYEDNYWGAMLLLAIDTYYIVEKTFYHYVVNYNSTIMRNNSLNHLDRLVIELKKIEEYKRRKIFEIYHDEIEYNFLKLFFLNTIRILFVRFAKIPYEIVYSIQDTVKELFPCYMNNPYLNSLPPLQMELIKIIEVDLDDEKIELLAREYRKVLIKENRKNITQGK